MMQIVDYSFARPGARAIRDAGYRGAVRYLSPPPNEKNLDAAERDELHRADLTIGLVWETTETRPREGFEAGRTDARRANAMADELGAPAHVAIYYAVDRSDTTPAMVRDYFRGVLEVGGRPAGVYGSEQVCEAMLDAGCRYAWQVETWGNRVSPRAHVVQLPNARPAVAETDVNDVHDEEWGGWHAGVRRAALPSQFVYQAQSERWIWLGPERVHSRCPPSVVAGLTAGGQVIDLGNKEPEFHRFLQGVASSSGFTG